MAVPSPPTKDEFAVKYQFEDVPQAVYDKLNQEVTIGGLPDYPHSFVPAVVTPKGERSRAFLEDWCRRHAKELEQLITARGALCFRGFDIPTPQDFEDVALSLCPRLNNVYHGTSPRNMVTEYTFTASELPNFFPIPQHLELSFVPSQPSRLMFWCGQPTKWGGSTSLCHFGLVWQDLPVELRAKFRRLGVKYYRNYSPPGAIRLDPTELKPWPDIFQTTDREKVEQSCRDDEFTLEWKPNNGIRLSNAMPAMRVHPKTGQEIWANHAQVFHPTTAYQEYIRIARFTGRWTFYLWAIVAFFIYALSLVFRRQEDFPMNTVFGDDSLISEEEMSIVRDAVWKHTINNPWQQGDVLYIDNRAVSHGRMPYDDYPGKKRYVLVAWSAD